MPDASTDVVTCRMLRDYPIAISNSGPKLDYLRIRIEEVDEMSSSQLFPIFNQSTGYGIIVGLGGRPNS